METNINFRPLQNTKVSKICRFTCNTSQYTSYRGKSIYHYTQGTKSIDWDMSIYKRVLKKCTIDFDVHQQKVGPMGDELYGLYWTPQFSSNISEAIIIVMSVCSSVPRLF